MAMRRWPGPKVSQELDTHQPKCWDPSGQQTVQEEGCIRWRVKHLDKTCHIGNPPPQPPGQSKPVHLMALQQHSTLMMGVVAGCIRLHRLFNVHAR